MFIQSTSRKDKIAKNISKVKSEYERLFTKSLLRGYFCGKVISYVCMFYMYTILNKTS